MPIGALRSTASAVLTIQQRDDPLGIIALPALWRTTLARWTRILAEETAALGGSGDCCCRPTPVFYSNSNAGRIRALKNNSKIASEK